MKIYTLNDLLTAQNLRCLLAPVRESSAPPAEKQKYVELLTTMMEGLSPEVAAEKFLTTFMPTYINLLSLEAHFGSAEEKYRLAAECTRAKILREAEFFAWVSRVKEDRAQQRNTAFWLNGRDHALIDGLLSSGNGLIIAMAKVGLMRHIPLELALSGYSTLLAASGNVYALWKELFSEASRPPLVELFNVENAAGALTIVRALRANRIVCINIEGETGAGGPWANVQKYPITFLSKQLVTRSGLVRLSARTAAPVLPVLAVRTGPQQGELLFGKPFLPGPATSRNDAAEGDAVQGLFTFLESVVLRHPSQYESFSNLHRLLPAGERNSHERQGPDHSGASAVSLAEGAVMINHDRCVVIPHASGVYCVDPVTMRAVRIPSHKTTVVDLLVKGSHTWNSCLQLPRHIPDADARCLTELVTNGMLQVMVPRQPAQKFAT